MNMTSKSRVLQIIGITPWLVAALFVSSHWIVSAENQANDDPRFTGLSSSMDAEGLRVSRRRFEAGARSAWHSHTFGQLLYVEEGSARTQKRGQALREMGPGESDYTGPDVEHWHGAAPSEHFIQVAVGFGSGIEWLDRTTDAEYGGR